MTDWESLTITVDNGLINLEVLEDARRHLVSEPPAATVIL